MWQNNRAERDKSHFETRKCISTWQKRLFCTSPLLHFSLFLSLFSLNLSCCPLHSGVHCHSAFGPLFIKKKETFIYKESIKASWKKGLSEAVLSGKNGTIHSHIPAHQLIFCSSPLYSMLSDTFHIKHVSLLNKWHSALLASVHSGCTVGWARVT